MLRTATPEARFQSTAKVGKVAIPAKDRTVSSNPDPTERYAKSGIYSWRFDRVDPYVYLEGGLGWR